MYDYLIGIDKTSTEAYKDEAEVQGAAMHTNYQCPGLQGRKNKGRIMSFDKCSLFPLPALQAPIANC